MYSLVVLLSNYSENFHVFISLVVACVLASVLFYLTVAPAHNLMKAYIAYRQGDERVKVRGHLKFSPKRSFNWMGAVSSVFLFLPIVHPIYYRKIRFDEPTKGVLAVSLSGPVFYFVSGILSAIVCQALRFFEIFGISGITNAVYAPEFAPFVYHCALSVVYFLSRLCFFSSFINLLPVIPMDLGEVLALVLRINWVDNLKNNEVFVSFCIFLGSFFTVARPTGLFSQMTADIMDFLALMF